MMSVLEVLDNNDLRIRLNALWQSAFSSRNQLSDFLRVMMNRKIGDFDAQEELGILITKIALRTDDGEDWVREAFCCLCRYRPSHLALRAFGDEVGWTVEAQPEQLTGLERVAGEPVSRRIVRNYGTQIRRTAARAGAIGVIKELHDLVDVLRRTVYLPLIEALPRLSDSSGRIAVTRFRRDLLESKRKIRDVARPPRFRDGEFPWIDEQLGTAAEALRLAAEAPTSGHVDDAISYLKDVVEVELTALDRRIESAARDLELDDLVSCLRALQDDLARECLGPDLIEALEADIEKLVRIEACLNDLVKLHQAWQRVDSALNALENTLELPLQDIVRRWNFLTSRLTTACPLGFDQDLPGLANSFAAFSASIAAQDKIRLGLDFPELATLLRDRFTGIDQDLLDECEHIKRVGASLNTVIEKLDG